MPDTRPRITFNEEGKCNACSWSEEKNKIDWGARQKKFGEICDTYRGNGTSPDVVVPWSGGKDSIYVADKMKEFGMTPLLLHVRPHLPLLIGEWNYQNMRLGCELLEINLKEDKYRGLAKDYFISQGRPKHPWECAISAVVLNQAKKLNIPFVVYGEEGEAEYGGSNVGGDWDKPVSEDYLREIYYQGNQLDWDMPTGKDFQSLFFTQYSRFENWSPSDHAHFAIAKGMRTEPVRNIGTFTGHSQNSDKLQDLHVYLMFLKFGFGRATSDASIALREGWTNKDETLEWIETYDGEFPSKYLQDYLDYFDMSYDEFMAVLDSHANMDIMSNDVPGIWHLKFPICKQRRKGTLIELQSEKRYG
jgi:N-acetyl sugar amidotransferase